MAAVLAALAAVEEEAREEAWERGARVAAVVTTAERAEVERAVCVAVGRMEGVRVAACGAQARAAAEESAVTEYAGVA